MFIQKLYNIISNNFLKYPFSPNTYVLYIYVGQILRHSIKYNGFERLSFVKKHVLLLFTSNIYLITEDLS